MALTKYGIVLRFVNLKAPPAAESSLPESFPAIYRYDWPLRGNNTALPEITRLFWVWPLRCGKLSENFVGRNLCEPTRAKIRATAVATFTSGHPPVCAQLRQEWKRFPGAGYRREHFCRRRSGCRAPSFAAIGAGFARGAHPTLSHYLQTAQVFSCSSRAYRADHSCRGLSTCRISIPAAIKERQPQAEFPPRESCFFCVKSFSSCQSFADRPCGECLWSSFVSKSIL